jgi:hypothetical protein
MDGKKAVGVRIYRRKEKECTTYAFSVKKNKAWGGGSTAMKSVVGCDGQESTKSTGSRYPSSEAAVLGRSNHDCPGMVVR